MSEAPSAGKFTCGTASKSSCLKYIIAAALLGPSVAAAGPDPAVEKLRQEVGSAGWILFSAKSKAGDYDLFVSRPDGAELRNITNTPDFNEYGGRFSPDGTKILYRRIVRREQVDHDLWGQFGVLVIAMADGSFPVAHGREEQYPWASWGPDGKQIACLYRREGQIRIFDLATKKLLKELPRQGIFQQLFWSPDGKQFCGTANVEGADWNIVTVDVATQKRTLLSRQLNCTSDWFRDSTRVIYAHRSPGLADGYGFTMMMQATCDGKTRTLVYGERDKHVYYARTSPDDRYVIFSLCPKDGVIDAPMAIVRMSDTPMVAPGYPELAELYPGARTGPVLRLSNLPDGFEPDWTSSNIGAEKK